MNGLRSLTTMPEVDKNRGYHNISMQDVIPRAWHASELSRDSRAGHVGGGSGLLPDFSTRRRKVGTPKKIVKNVDQTYRIRSEFIHHGDSPADLETVAEFFRNAWACFFTDRKSVVW